MSLKAKFQRLSQAALEFIMTYGWAILVVVASIAVLAYFGVLSPDNFIPQRCVLAPGITCLDYNVETYRIILVLHNSKGEPITIDRLTVSGNNQQCSDNQTVTINNDAKAIITITQCNNGVEGTKFSGIINVSYTPEDKLVHDVIGSLRAKVTPGQPISSQSSCQNAETKDLCDGLDIVYGLGYRYACCAEHGLCC